MSHCVQLYTSTSEKLSWPRHYKKTSQTSIIRLTDRTIIKPKVLFYHKNTTSFGTLAYILGLTSRVSTATARHLVSSLEMQDEATDKCHTPEAEQNGWTSPSRIKTHSCQLFPMYNGLQKYVCTIVHAVTEGVINEDCFETSARQVN